MARDAYKVPELVYAPAKRAGIGLLIMLAGSSGTGKTKSALELAVGLAGDDGRIGFADTENGRGLYYADQYKFDHLFLREPFRPEAFEAAAVVSQKAGHRVWICDNFSWEHIGPGGLLNFHDQELDRLAGEDWNKRERMNMLAWVKPKEKHRSMMQRLWQLNGHVILCCQAQKKTEQVKDEKTGKIKIIDIGLHPVVGEDVPYAMSTTLMLSKEAGPGVPEIYKSQEALDKLIPTDRQLSAETGRALAAWARGETAKPRTDIRTEEAKGEARNIQVAETLAARFKGTKTRAEHLAIVDDDKARGQIEWLRKKRPLLFEQVNDALAASWERGEPKGGAAGGESGEDPPPADPPATDPPPTDPPPPTGEDDGWPGPKFGPDGKLIEGEAA